MPFSFCPLPLLCRENTATTCVCLGQNHSLVTQPGIRSVPGQLGKLPPALAPRSLPVCIVLS